MTVPRPICLTAFSARVMPGFFIAPGVVGVTLSLSAANTMWLDGESLQSFSATAARLPVETVMTAVLPVAMATVLAVA